MQTNELYFLILVCGAMGVLMLTLAIGTVHDRRWARKQAQKVAETRR